MFLANAALLCAASALLLLSPFTVSHPVAEWEATAILIGLAGMLLVNLWLVRRALTPLDRLSREMEQVDLLDLRPARDHAAGSDGEVRRLAEAFDRMLARLASERRASAGAALAAQEAERLRVARELHDEVGQSLTGLLLLLDKAADGDAEQLEHARAAARASLADVRRIAQRLRPELLDDLGLTSALSALALGFARQTGLRVDRRFAPDLPPLGPDVELAVYRIAQESLTNVARHAAATKVELSLEPAGERVRLRVQDDGRGLPPGLAPASGGLRGMQERAVLIGATLQVTSPPDGGTTVRLEL